MSRVERPKSSARSLKSRGGTATNRKAYAEQPLHDSSPEEHIIQRPKSSRKSWADNLGKFQPKSHWNKIFLKGNNDDLPPFATNPVPNYSEDFDSSESSNSSSLEIENPFAKSNNNSTRSDSSFNRSQTVLSPRTIQSPRNSIASFQIPKMITDKSQTSTRKQWKVDDSIPFQSLKR